MTKSIDFSPEKVDLICYAGDGVSLQLNSTDENGNVISLDGEFIAQVRKNRMDAQPLASFKIDATNAADGVVIIWLSGADTAGLLDSSEPFEGVWDVQWTSTENPFEPKTLAQGILTCNADVSR